MAVRSVEDRARSSREFSPVHSHSCERSPTQDYGSAHALLGGLHVAKIRHLEEFLLVLPVIAERGISPHQRIYDERGFSPVRSHGRPLSGIKPFASFLLCGLHGGEKRRLEVFLLVHLSSHIVASSLDKSRADAPCFVDFTSFKTSFRSFEPRSPRNPLQKILALWSKDFFIQSAGLVYHHALACISSAREELDIITAEPCIPFTAVFLYLII